MPGCLTADNALVRPPPAPPQPLAHPPPPAHRRQPPPRLRPGLPRPDVPEPDHLLETLILAAALDRLPPRPLTRAQQTAFLHQLASCLQLLRLAPADHDLLWQRLTTR